jgi:hypothetical protein
MSPEKNRGGRPLRGAGPGGATRCAPPQIGLPCEPARPDPSPARITRPHPPQSQHLLRLSLPRTPDRALRPPPSFEKNMQPKKYANCILCHRYSFTKKISYEAQKMDHRRKRPRSGPIIRKSDEATEIASGRPGGPIGNQQKPHV